MSHLHMLAAILRLAWPVVLLSVDSRGDEVYRDSDSLLYPAWLRIGPESGYDKFTHPQHNSTTPVAVEIKFYVENLGNFQVTTMDYDLDIYFIERWVDGRLAHAGPECRSLGDRRVLGRLWLPDLYFANSKMAAYNDITVPNFAFVLCPDGAVRYSSRIALKMTCQMNLKDYPFDIQHCTIKVLPYGSHTDKMIVTWAPKDDITVDKDIMETDLKLVKTSVTYCNGTYYGKSYSCLLATFMLRRTLSLSLIQIYVPTAFIVVISWISFWIDPSSVPGRVGLAVTTLLTLSTQVAAMTFQLPPVGYAKALDYWLGMCLAFLFATLIEFTVVNNYTRRWQSALRKARPTRDEAELNHDRAERGEELDIALANRRRPTTLDAMLDEPFVTDRLWPETEARERRVPTANGGAAAPTTSIRDTADLRRRALHIDKVSRIVFPIAFVILSFVYWLIFVVF